MATVAALGSPGWKWHTRGAWSARDDRVAFAVWLALLWGGMIAGFGVDMGRFVHEVPQPRVMSFHIVVFIGWMLLLTAQVLLVVGDRVALHRKLGWFTVGWACLMAVLGPWTALASHALNPQAPEFGPPFLVVQFGDITAFAVFVAWAILLRKNLAAHKRIMILATIALSDAGFGRVVQWIWPIEPQPTILWFLWNFYGDVLMILLVAGWDWRRGRLMKQFVIGAAGLVVAEGLETLLYHWEPWRTFATGLVLAWAKHFG